MLSIGRQTRLGLLLILGLLGTALSPAGCSPRHNDETLAGVTVPIPARMEKLATSQEQVNLGTQQKGEQASFRGEMSRSEIVRFYQEVLPAGDWKPDARLGAEIGGYVFTRGDETIAIRITETDSNTSVLTVLVNAGEFSPAGRDTVHEPHTPGQ